MNKIEIITPVHIGSGDKIESPCFYRENDDDTVAKRYSFSDILSQLPPSVLTDPRFLRNLSRSQNNKKAQYQNIDRYINYSKLNELYCVKDENEYDLSESGYDIYEQIKDLDKPYIPGSSIKGALINAWFYYLVKINLLNNRNLRKNIDSVLSSKDFKERSNANQKTIFNYLFSDTKDHSNFMKDLQSCLVCRDLYFNQIEVLWSERIGSGKEMQQTIPLSYKECIQANQTIYSEFMYVDEDKKDRIYTNLDSYIDKRLSDSEKKKIKKHYEIILNGFKESVILKACNIFTQDVLELDAIPKYQTLYHNRRYDIINAQTQKLQEEIKKSQKTKEKVAYLRIGNSTNYFSKTISLLFKKQLPDLYKEYFDFVLSPNSSKKSKTRANKENVPKTRVVYSSYDQAYLPGFIKIYYDE